uniref:sporulation initiation factor Spo0A C-terminal domain-containing protein n=1 Tax=Enterocloster hominis (ex Hitch et al. 2024) TaxID=1917870 RepID=UPI00102F484D|nr:sporulation initiation factor Spo0A C-terminal domain-containing protein [Lachnoclostridium pacaense]
MQTMEGLFKEIAGHYGVSDEAVKREMESAIRDTFTTPQDEEVIKLQNQIPRKGKIPTLEEFLLYVIQEVQNETNEKDGR